MKTIISSLLANSDYAHQGEANNIRYTSGIVIKGKSGYVLSAVILQLAFLLFPFALNEC